MKCQKYFFENNAKLCLINFDKTFLPINQLYAVFQRYKRPGIVPIPDTVGKFKLVLNMNGLLVKHSHVGHVGCMTNNQGPVVQNFVSLTSSLRQLVK